MALLTLRCVSVPYNYPLALRKQLVALVVDFIHCYFFTCACLGGFGAIIDKFREDYGDLIVCSSSLKSTEDSLSSRLAFKLFYLSNNYG